MKRYHSKSQLKQKQLLLNLILWLIASCSSGVYAIEKAVLEEIIVTARKTEENLQEVPISVTAFSSTDIEARGLADMEDIALSVPNVSFSRNLGIAVLSVRGITDEDLLVTSDPLVGVYVDGVYISRLQGGFLEMVDAERIEVLKGPQGTLFGKNTVGGAVSIISKTPQGDGNGYLKAAGGEDGHFSLQGSYDIGITDDLSLKLSGLHKRRNCLVRRESDNACLDDEDVKVFRAYANYQFSDDFRAALILDGSWDDSHSQVMGVTVVEPSGLFTGIYEGARALDPALPAYAPVGLDDPFVTDGNGPTDDKIRSYGVSLQLEWQFLDNLTLRSISAYRDFESINYIEFDNFRETMFQNDGLATLSETFSQELIFEGVVFDERLNLQAGLYYFNEDAKNDSKIRLPVNFFGGWNQFITSEVDSISGFGHLSYELTDRLRLSGGVRYTSENRDFSAVGDFVSLPAGNQSFQPLVSDSDTWTAWSPKATLDFNLNEDILVYATWSKGFRSGGFNGNTVTSDPDLNRYDPEFVTNYEIGLKSTLWGNRVIFNAAVYFMEYKDKQFSFQLAQANDVPIAVRDNAARAELLGTEMDLKVALTEKLKLEAGFAYNDAEYTKLREGALGLRISLDSPFQYAPETTANFGLQYTEPNFAGIGEASFRVDAAYKSRIFFNTVPAEINDPLLGSSNSQDGYAKVNARITLAPDETNWTLTLYAHNLTDKIITEFNLGIPGSGFDRASYGQPREIGVEVRYDF